MIMVYCFWDPGFVHAQYDIVPRFPREKCLERWNPEKQMAGLHLHLVQNASFKWTKHWLSTPTSHPLSNSVRILLEKKRSVRYGIGWYCDDRIQAAAGYSSLIFETIFGIPIFSAGHSYTCTRRSINITSLTSLLRNERFSST